MLSLSITGFAQQGPNRFDEESSRVVDNSNDQLVDGTKDEPAQSNPGNPGDIVPIDDYIPLLIMTALGIILYTTRKKRKLLS